MRRPVRFILALTCVVGAGGDAWAFDHRIDPDLGRAGQFSFGFSALGRLAGKSVADASGASLPSEYPSAMTWYRAALSSGERPLLVASPWLHHSDLLPEALRWTWKADNGDLISRVGSGAFRMAFGDQQANWFRELNCQMVAWPGADLQATIQCEDGSQRTMTIPEEGFVVLDDVPYRRAFRTEPVSIEAGHGEPQ